MRLTHKAIRRPGQLPELVLTGRRVDAPRRRTQPLDMDRLFMGGALTGPMFEHPSRPLRIIQAFRRLINPGRKSLHKAGDEQR